MASPYQTNLPTLYRALYRAQFATDLARGTAHPFIIPSSLAGAAILPVLYLSVPHRKRPWRARMRFPVAVAALVLNADVLRRGTSSANFAVAYAAGLVAAWGSVWGVGLLLFADVQTRLARVRLRRKRGVGRAEKGQGKKEAVDESEERVLRDGRWEHYWQGFPEEGSFGERLEWVWDLYTSFRGVGWNIAIPVVPHPSPPADARSGSPVSLASMPLVSSAGYCRSRTYREFLLNRLFHMTWSYLALDFWTITARFDPYFVPGPPPSPSHPLPPVLAGLHPAVLGSLRSLFAAAGVLGALYNYFNFGQVMSALTPFRGYNPLWQYPSIGGSFSRTVLDRGLAGFWGGWWHQSFRVGFTLPTAFLVRNGWLPSARSTVTRAAGMFIAFLLSGLMHSAGGYTTVPKTTNAWTPMLFFLMQCVGIAVQTLLVVVARQIMGEKKIPMIWKRVGNLAFAAAWLHWTNWALISDMSRGALWLYEPIPWSPLRAMGFGPPGDSVWRWDAAYIPRWHSGRYWRESGIKL